jgi:hypothetical protein
VQGGAGWSLKLIHQGACAERGPVVNSTPVQSTISSGVKAEKPAISVQHRWQRARLCYSNHTMQWNAACKVVAKL